MRRPNAASLTRGRGYQTQFKSICRADAQVQVVGARAHAAAADATLVAERTERAVPPRHACSRSEGCRGARAGQGDLGTLRGEQLGLEGEAQANIVDCMRMSKFTAVHEAVHGRA